MIPKHTGRFIIGGSSPYALQLPGSILDTGTVIGLNRWPSFQGKMDYWLCCDTDLAMRDYPDLVESIQVPRFMQRYDHIPDAPAEYWFGRVREYIPTQWEGRLYWHSTSACAAVNLACLMGATEILLYGVDLIPGGRADGSQYDTNDHWERWVKPVNETFHRIRAAFKIPIYKLNPASPLDLPLYPLLTQ